MEHKNACFALFKKVNISDIYSITNNIVKRWTSVCSNINIFSYLFALYYFLFKRMSKRQPTADMQHYFLLFFLGVCV